MIFILIISSILSSNLNSYQESIFLGLFLNSIIIPTLFVFKKINIYEPVFWFSIYYSVLIFSAFILLDSQFTASTFIVNTNFYTSNILELFSITLWTVLFAYLSFITGYYLIVNKKTNINITLNEPNTSFILLKIFAYIFMSIGISNFVYNLYIMTGFNIIDYFGYIHYYSGHLVEHGVTIIGYNFLYPGIFFLYYLHINKKINKYIFYLNFLIFLTIILSLGRVTGFAMTVMVFYILSLYSKGVFNINKRQIILLFLSIIVIFTLFFLRMYSDFERVYGVEFDEFITVIVPNIGYILIGEGNLPNISIVMKIIDSWEQDIGYLYGGSIFVGLTAFLPSSISVELVRNNTTSWIGKHTWYEHIHGGSLPPTIVGDLFANFGFLGVLIGMFLLGYLFAKVYNLMHHNKSIFIFIFYLYFLIFFAFILPKGEFSRLSFVIIPIFILLNIYLIKMLTILGRKKKKLEKV